MSYMSKEGYEALVAELHRLEALKAMKAEADTKNWWPTRALLQKAQHKGEHRYGGIRKDPPFELALTDGICLFLFGSAKDPDALKAALAGDRGRELARAVAMSVCKICAEEPDFAFANLADPRLRIMRYYLNAAFLMGRDVRKVMTALDRGLNCQIPQEIYDLLLARMEAGDHD